MMETEETDTIYICSQDFWYLKNNLNIYLNVTKLCDNRTDCDLAMKNVSVLPIERNNAVVGGKPYGHCSKTVKWIM
jgi:hypothetical protein